MTENTFASEAAPSALAQQPYTYRLENPSGHAVAYADKLEEIEAVAQNLGDGVYTLLKVMRRYTIETPQPKARVSFAATSTRAPRKPKAERKPKAGVKS